MTIRLGALLLLVVLMGGYLLAYWAHRIECLGAAARYWQACRDDETTGSIVCTSIHRRLSPLFWSSRIGRYGRRVHSRFTSLIYVSESSDPPSVIPDRVP